MDSLPFFFTCTKIVLDVEEDENRKTVKTNKKITIIKTSSVINAFILFKHW